MISGTDNIDVLDLPVRAYNQLRREGINTIDDVLNNKEFIIKYPKLYALVSKALEDHADEGLSLEGAETTIEEHTIVNIPIEDIKPHPKNPRKDVGDVSELAESIKSNGIMQNLTVIPNNDGGYTALIGHRRLAAAKLAGLNTVPCLIASNLTESEQVAIMLTENIHREALTTIEEAEGIQMMLDLGDTVSSVSAKTGMSETTIRRRRSLLDMDKALVTEAQERGATLDDFDRIRSIKDEAQRKKCLEAAGTASFEYTLKSAESAEKHAEKAKKLIAWLKSFAVAVYETPTDYKYYKTINVWNFNEDAEIPTGEGYVYINRNTYYEIYRPYTADEQAQRDEYKVKEEMEQRKRDRISAKIKQLEKILADIHSNHVDFINSFVKMPKGHTLAEAMIIYFGISTEIDSYLVDYSDYDPKYDRSDEEAAKKLLTTIGKDYPERSVLIWLYNELTDEVKGVYNFINRSDGTYSQDEMPWKLKVIDFLRCFGYVPSTTEIGIYSGTHEIYEAADDEA